MRFQSPILFLVLLLAVKAITLTAVQAATDTQADVETLGDDGLHKQDWFSLTFRDVAEDLEDASADNKRLVILFEQPGGIYCKKNARNSTGRSGSRCLYQGTLHRGAIQSFRR